MRAVIVCNIRSYGISSGSCGRGAYHGGRATDLFFPCHKRLHGCHETIVADDKQLASLFDGRVFRHRLAVVDVTAFVHLLELGVEREASVAALDDVPAVVAFLHHAQNEAVVDPEDFGDGVVLERNDHHVLASHIAMDVRLVEGGNRRGEESVRCIGLPVGVRHIIRVDATREVAF